MSGTSGARGSEATPATAATDACAHAAVKGVASGDREGVALGVVTVVAGGCMVVLEAEVAEWMAQVASEH
jgi:hypothetical protein